MNQTKSNQGYWYTVLVWAAVTALCLTLSARAAGVRRDSRRGKFQQTHLKLSSPEWQHTLSTVVSVKEDPILPSVRHFHAASQKQECSVYQAIVGKLKRELSEKKNILGEIKADLTNRRMDLEKCAILNGLVNRADEKDEISLALVCAKQYDHWLAPGYRVAMVRQEVDELNEGIETAMDHLLLKCPRRSFNEF